MYILCKYSEIIIITITITITVTKTTTTITIIITLHYFLFIFLFRNKEKIDRIVSSLNLKISTRDSKYTDTRIHLQAVLRQWLPMSTAILDMVCKVLPSPLEIGADRVENLMCGGFKKFDSYPEETRSLKQGEIIKLFS